MDEDAKNDANNQPQLSRCSARYFTPPATNTPPPSPRSTNTRSSYHSTDSTVTILDPDDSDIDNSPSP